MLLVVLVVLRVAITPPCRLLICPSYSPRMAGIALRDPRANEVASVTGNVVSVWALLSRQGVRSIREAVKGTHKESSQPQAPPLPHYPAQTNQKFLAFADMAQDRHAYFGLVRLGVVKDAVHGVAEGAQCQAPLLTV